LEEEVVVLWIYRLLLPFRRSSSLVRESESEYDIKEDKKIFGNDGNNLRLMTSIQDRLYLGML
jgi:hypothetical protein